MKYVVHDQLALRRPLRGPLAGHIPAYAQWVADQGYARYSLHRKVFLAAEFSRWLDVNAILPSDISSENRGRYLGHRARNVCVRSDDAFSLSQFVEFTCRRTAVKAEKLPSKISTPADECAYRFARYLAEERVLASRTIDLYLPFVRRFLEAQFGQGPVALSDLCAGDVVRFVRRQASQLHRKQAKLMMTALRSFLRYGCYQGELSNDLVGAVPTVACWTMASIPRGISADQVSKLLSSINRDTVVGCRDYAVVLLLARLGLRLGAVTKLELGDIDWAQGCLRVQTKGARCHELPLPSDVGEAIVAYLMLRPRCASRRIFLRAKAPIDGFRSLSGIDSIIRRAIVRAGVISPTRGAHQFRHGLATRLLGSGASLTEIGELLGHRSPQTTMIYAKVDIGALRALALSWPGGAR